MATNSYKGQSNRISADELPDDVEDELSATFSPDVIYALLRDAYYRGPRRVGVGGEQNVYGNGKVGEGLRRPDGPLYDYPESWRNSVLRKAVVLDLVQVLPTDAETLDASENRYVVTDRGLDLLLDADRCEECGRVNRPTLKNAGSSRKLTTLSTECPVHAGGGGYERDEDDLSAAASAVEGVEGVHYYANDDSELRARDPDGLRSELHYGDRVEISGGRADGATGVVLDGLERDDLPEEFAKSMGPVNSVYAEEGVVVLLDGSDGRLTGSARAVDRTELRLVEENAVEEVPVFTEGAKVRASADGLTREVVQRISDDYYRVRYPSSNPYSEGEQSTALFHALELTPSTRPLNAEEPEFEEGDEVRYLRNREDHNLGTPAVVARVVEEDYDEEKGHYYVLNHAETGDYLSGARETKLLSEADARKRDPDGEPFEEGDYVNVEDEEGVYRVFDAPTPTVEENTYIYSVVPEGTSTKSELSSRSRFPRNRPYVRQGDLSPADVDDSE